MSKYQRIPRPRHLFPELAAFLIEWKRTNLRARRNLQRAIGHVPIWVTGALAGITGIMLTISLFFVHDTKLQAAATPRTEPAFVPAPAAAPVIPPPIQVEAPRPQLQSLLQARIIRTELPMAWDESLVTTKTSLTSQTPATLGSLPSDAWRMAQERRRPSSDLSPYLIRGAGLASSWPALTAADSVSTSQKIVSQLGLGLVVEKIVPSDGAEQQSLTYQIVIRNTSSEVIERVLISEWMPDLTRVVDTVPNAGISGDELVWNVEDLGAGTSRTILVSVVPDKEGEIQTETRVVPSTRFGASVLVKPAPTPDLEVLPFEPAAAPQSEPKPEPIVKSIPGHPELKLTYTEVKPLKKGDDLSMIFSVSNIGTAPADDVVLFVRLSGEFEHRYGEYVKHQVGTLKPGETRRALLQAIARDSGEAHLDASLTMQGAETESRELKIPIRSEAPAGTGKEQPLVQKPVFDQNARWIAAEQKR